MNDCGDGPGPVDLLCPTIAAKASHDHSFLISLPNELLKKILEKLAAASDLLNSRLVNLTWRDFCGEVLIRRMDIRLAFRYNPALGAFSSELDDSKNGTLEKLNGLLRKSKGIFPCSKFGIFRGDLASRDVQDFLALHGHRIKDLALDLDSRKSEPYTHLTRIPEILLQRIPNIESLYIEGSPSRWKKRIVNNNNNNSLKTELTPKSSKTGGQILLKKLKSIYFNEMDLNDEGLVLQTDILEAAPNLDSLTGADVRLVDFLIDTGRIKFLREFSLDPKEESDLSFFDKFSTASPKFRYIGLILEFIYDNPELGHKVGSILSAILESSKDSLEDLELRYPIGMSILPGLVVPQMKNVAKLHLSVTYVPEDLPPVDPDAHDHDPGQPQIGDEFLVIPRRFSMASTFPNLRNVTLYCFQLADDPHLERSFPFLEGAENAVPSVKSLELMRMSSQIWMRKIQAIFPNVQHLAMFELEDFPDVAEFVWRWDNLQGVKLELLVHERKYPRNCFPFLDASITGFSERDCGKLECPGRSISTNIQPVNPSILNLAGLKSFEMEFYGDPNLTSSQIPHKLLSRVVQRYAFKTMRDNNVQVTVQAVSRKADTKQKISEALKPVYLDP